MFNADTVDEVLQDLMERGIKVAGGDKLGKTIIFAQNKKTCRVYSRAFLISSILIITEVLPKGSYVMIHMLKLL